MLYASHDYQPMACGSTRVFGIMSDVLDGSHFRFGAIAVQQRRCWSSRIDDDLYHFCYWCLGMSILTFTSKADDRTG